MLTASVAAVKNIRRENDFDKDEKKSAHIHFSALVLGGWHELALALRLLDRLPGPIFCRLAEQRAVAPSRGELRGEVTANNGI